MWAKRFPIPISVCLAERVGSQPVMSLGESTTVSALLSLTLQQQLLDTTTASSSFFLFHNRLSLNCRKYQHQSTRTFFTASLSVLSYRSV
ncbi:hypothetical protein F4604DRAFT_498331 [Suillus subluteus]|nr:hypothetical protein F4604DRAFT_498331 [Suillus subluteus]